ncbi:MAG: 2Fe-2S iron-sulfur cluster binding domain-containing protein, partial [Lachnospiraceae bacterium]|nr:2Fe-2S iron-sulfur cluster binding domain-containing protein [Lachnospiraceae bacterium]
MAQQITFEDGKKMTVSTGSSLLEVLRRLGIPVSADCGGLGTCGKCTVLVNGRPVKSCRYEIEEDIEVSLLPDGFAPSFSYDMTGVEGGALKGAKDGERDGARDDVREDAYAMAVDLGTTTIAGYLLSLETGRCVSQMSIANPQISFGA